MNERVLGRLLGIAGSIAIITVAAPYRSAGQETTRPEPPAAAARVAITDLVMDPSPVERSGTAARFSVAVHSDYPAPAQIIVSVRGLPIGPSPMGTARTVARGDTLVRIPGQRTVSVAGPEPQQRCIVVEGRVNE
ncbi:MAG: hypothetical protein ACT4PY_12930, partial [Armatimonadota bacterium]